MGQILAIAGTDKEVFKANSTWSASSLKTVVNEVSLTGIIKQGHWSQALTFQRFYIKCIKECNSNFQSGILDKQLWKDIKEMNFSNKGRTAVLDWSSEISRSEIKIIYGHKAAEM